jgi:metal-responsive CopG/Arc/MetJ family transcriptional regulator
LEGAAMAKVLLSIPDEELKKIDDYRKKKGLKRNQFFMEAANSYFKDMEKEQYFSRRKQAVNNIKITSEEIMKLGIKDWDPVKELRKVRDGRAEELLKRWDRD